MQQQHFHPVKVTTAGWVNLLAARFFNGAVSFQLDHALIKSPCRPVARLPFLSPSPLPLRLSPRPGARHSPPSSKQHKPLRAGIHPQKDASIPRQFLSHKAMEDRLKSLDDMEEDCNSLAGGPRRPLEDQDSGLEEVCRHQRWAPIVL